MDWISAGKVGCSNRRSFRCTLKAKLSGTFLCGYYVFYSRTAKVIYYDFLPVET
jgi:hypothetical protein